MANVSTMEINPFMVKAIQSYKGKKGELSFKTDQEILVTQSNVKEFLYYGKLDGKEGLYLSLSFFNFSLFYNISFLVLICFIL